jgi:single-strand DNA-binding protein
MNQVFLVGNSGANAELQYTQKNFPILNISLATSRKEKEEWKSTWHRVVILGKTAESVAPLIKKGSRVFVNGEIQSREWTDKEGNKRVAFEILAREVHVLEKPQKQSHMSELPDDSGYSGQTNQTWSGDDIPF